MSRQQRDGHCVAVTTWPGGRVTTPMGRSLGHGDTGSLRKHVAKAPLGLVVLLLGCPGRVSAEPEKVRLIHVDSYHREYAGSWAAIEGLDAGLLEVGWVDSQEQLEALRANDAVESSTAVIQRLWMDSKRKDTKPELMESAVALTEQVKAFQPTLLLLSDDNAVNYIGNQFLDTELPIVFYGVKNTPVKYGLVDDPQQPGHNVTGVYAIGFYTECLALLKRLVPGAKTFAILSDETGTGRSHLKGMEDAARQPDAPLQLIETVVTKKFEEWQQKALELQERVDAFYLAAMNGLEDAEGREIPREEALRWYLTHIHIPETIHGETYVKQGLLCAADFARFNQGYDGVLMAHDMLTKGLKPATYPARVASRGPLVVNRQRATMLGITLTPEMGIEKIIEEASVLKDAAGAEAKP